MNLTKKLDKTIKDIYKEKHPNKKELLEQVAIKLPQVEKYVISKRINLFFKVFELN